MIRILIGVYLAFVTTLCVGDELMRPANFDHPEDKRRMDKLIQWPEIKGDISVVMNCFSQIDKNGKMVPFLEVLSDLIKRGVEVRLIHAKEPGPAFREDFDRYPNLIEGMERILCPRIHLKTVIVDGRFAYTGSANLTGAGMGAKSKKRRNFEAGIITMNPELIDKLMDQFDSIWMGTHCKDCGRKEYCADMICQQ